jgi:hypothetical protein
MPVPELMNDGLPIAPGMGQHEVMVERFLDADAQLLK